MGVYVSQRDTGGKNVLHVCVTSLCKWVEALPAGKRDLSLGIFEINYWVRAVGNFPSQTFHSHAIEIKLKF